MYILLYTRMCTIRIQPKRRYYFFNCPRTVSPKGHTGFAIRCVHTFDHGNRYGHWKTGFDPSEIRTCSYVI